MQLTASYPSDAPHTDAVGPPSQPAVPVDSAHSRRPERSLRGAVGPGMRRSASSDPPALRPFVSAALGCAGWEESPPPSQRSDQSARGSLSPYRLCCLHWLWENKALIRLRRTAFRPPRRVWTRFRHKWPTLAPGMNTELQSS